MQQFIHLICLGCGNSDEPKNSLDIDDYVSFIIKFVEQQNIKELELIGHSNGGRIIIKLMNSKKLNFKVNRIVLIGSAGIVHKKSLSKKLKIRMFKISKKILSINILQNKFPNLLLKIKNCFGSVDYKTATPIMRETLVKLVNTDLKEYLPHINVPTLLIWGTDDKETPISDALAMEKLIPDSGLVKVQNCSHYVFLEEPIYVNRVIRFFLNGENK